MAGEITLRELSPQLREFIENSSGGGSINADIKTCGFTAEKGQTTFTIPFDNYIAEECYLDVKVNSIWVSPNEYAVNIREVVFNTPLEEGTEVFFTIYLLGTTAVNSISADVVVENENKKFVTSQEKSKIADIDILGNDRGYLNPRLVMDANLAKDSGKYQFDVGCLNSPNVGWAFMVDVFKQIDYNNRVQVATAYYPTSIPFSYVRICVNDSWGEWKQLATIDDINNIRNQSSLFTAELDGSGDLNNYITNCKIKIAWCTGIANTPFTDASGNNAVVEVFEGYNGVTQVYHSGNGKKTFIRYYASWASPQWTDWQQIATTDKVAQNRVLTTLDEVNNPNLDSGIYSGEGATIQVTSTLYTAYYMLIVNKHRINSGYGSQMLIPYDNGWMQGVYYRNCSAGTWNAWQQLATTTRVPFSCTASEGFEIVSQDCFVINNHVYIDIWVKSISGSMPTNTQFRIANSPYYTTISKSAIATQWLGIYDSLVRTNITGVINHIGGIYINTFDSNAPFVNFKCDFEL